VKLLVSQPASLLSEVDALCHELEARKLPSKGLAVRLGDVQLRLQDASALNFRRNKDDVLSGPDARAALDKIRNTLAGGRKGAGRKGRGYDPAAAAADAWRAIAKHAVQHAPRGYKREMRQELGLVGKRRRSRAH
jgi:hypothetical protein